MPLGMPRTINYTTSPYRKGLADAQPMGIKHTRRQQYVRFPAHVVTVVIITTLANPTPKSKFKATA